MKWILYFLMFVPAITIAQTDSLAPIEFTEVVNIDSATKVQLFEQGRRWFAATFGDSKSVLEISDKESGELTGKGNVKFYHTLNNTITDYESEYSGIITFQISILFKDGKYKVTITNFTHEATHKIISQYGSRGPVSVGRLYYKTVLHPVIKGNGGGMFEKYYMKQENEVYTLARQKALKEGADLLKSLEKFMRSGNYSKSDDW